jgi:FecR protein
MVGYKWTPALMLAVLFALHSTVAKADPLIGTAASTKPNAEGVIGTNTQTLTAGSELYENETVRTGGRGVADLVFVDRTNLSVGPASEVHLDKFVYDPAGSNGAVVLNATRGAFRFVTGSQDHRVYRVNTPYGTLGVRGTTVEGVIQPNIVGKAVPKDVCIAKFRLSEGAGLTFTRPNGQTYELTEIGTCICVHPDGTVTTDTCPPIYIAGAGPPGPPPPPPTGGGGGCIETPTMSCPTR